MPRLLLFTFLLVAVPASGAMVTQRWGVQGAVQHQGTLRFEAAGEGGVLMTFDLSALPRNTTIYRARLFFFGTNWKDTGFDIVPAAGTPPRPTGQPLVLVGPWFQWFDCTRVVREWAATGGGGSLWLRRAPRFTQEATFLEIAYEGKLASTPQQVQDVRASCRSGQVFVTFRELEPLDGGRTSITWGELSEHLIPGFYGPKPKQTGTEVRYRVYRHDKPITAGNIGSAELLAEVVPGSGYNTRVGAEEDKERKVLRARTIGPEQGNMAQVEALRLAVEPGKPLEPGIGLYVHTVSRDGTGYYAVVTAVDGLENTTDISGANVAGPIAETPGTPEPVLYREFDRPVQGDEYVEQWYSYWTVQPLSPWPARYDVVVAFCPKLMAKPAALHVVRGHAWTSYPEPPSPQPTPVIYMTMCSDAPNEFYTGMHESVETLRGFDGGSWRTFAPNRQNALIQWVGSKWDIDENQIVAHVGAWGLQEIKQGELYAYIRGWGLPELTKGFQAWGRACGVWGEPGMYKGRPDDENPYVVSNITDWVLAHPEKELPYFWIHGGWGAHFTEMGWPPFPRFVWAMMRTKRAFVYSFHGSPVGDAIGKGQLAILRNQSLPAFANCSADDNLGEGELRSGDGYAESQVNGYLLWDPQTIVDEPERWEMTVWLDASCRFDDCTVDLTPRRCQKFLARPGERFEWTNTSLKDNSVVGAGSTSADEWGLVTIEGLKVDKARNRVMITRSSPGGRT